MIKRSIYLSLAAASVALAENPAPQTNTPSVPKTISIEEMLVTGNSGMRLHSLAMITQGKVKGEIDESFLPGFKACSEDPASPVRSVAARIMGQTLVAGRERPNPEAIGLLMKLARDESADVRFNAIYHGLSQLNEKPDKVVALLLEVAASNREHNLYGRIRQSMENSREQATLVLDRKLEAADSVAIYEIYEDMAGKAPSNTDRFLDLPSSRPKMFIFKGGGDDAETSKAKLEAELNSARIESPELFISGVGTNHVLLLKTYLTKDRIAVEKAFANHEKFQTTQEMWLTPELEIQINAMRKQ